MPLPHMSCYWAGLLSLTAFCLAPPAQAQLINNAPLVNNGGFETADFTGWALSGNADNTSTTPNTFVFGASHSGDYAAWLGPAGTDGFLSQTLATTAGTTYTVSYWLAVDTNSDLASAKFGMSTPNDFSAAFGGQTFFSQTDLAATDSHADPADDYTQYTFTAVATSASSSLAFGFRDDFSEFRLDDVSVTPAAVPEASTTISFGFLLTLGGMSLVHLRRKRLI